jgi:dUTP pyrophosphatase
MTAWVKFKKLSTDAKAPLQATDGSAAVDLHATSLGYPVGGNLVEYGTGLAFEIPKGHVGLLFPRSGVSNTGQHLSNSVGVIDSDYRGEVKVRMYLLPEAKKYGIGERCCQLMIVPIPQVKYQLVDDLEETSRGSGGFGSTGK